MSVLERIVADKRAEVERLRPRRRELRERAEAAGPSSRPFADAVRRGGEVALIGELKRRSPSAGAIRPELEPEEVAAAYAEAGAAAVSVLTDEPYFGGTLDDLRAVREALELPVLRKDFTIDPVQLWRARAAGADAALLIVRVLDDAQLRDFVALGRELGLGMLVEAHDGRELERALKAEAEVVGINNRDLTTFETDLDTALELAGEVPVGRVCVAESGIGSAADVDRLGTAGVHAILVGESLMRAGDLTAAAAALVARPREERG